MTHARWRVVHGGAKGGTVGVICHRTADVARTQHTLYTRDVSHGDNAWTPVNNVLLYSTEMVRQRRHMLRFHF